MWCYRDCSLIHGISAILLGFLCIPFHITTVRRTDILNRFVSFLLSLNIRNGMKEYITNSFLRKEIDNKYEELKISISELDAEMKLMVENAKDKNILVSNNVFKYLEKYDITVWTVENDENLTDKVLSDIKNQIENKNIKYIIMMPNDTLTDEVEDLLNSNNIEKLYIDPLTTLSSENIQNGKDYISVMNDNLEILKKELYED